MIRKEEYRKGKKGRGGRRIERMESGRNMRREIKGEEERER